MIIHQLVINLGDIHKAVIMDFAQFEFCVEFSGM